MAERGTQSTAAMGKWLTTILKEKNGAAFCHTSLKIFSSTSCTNINGSIHYLPTATLVTLVCI